MCAQYVRAGSADGLREVIVDDGPGSARRQLGVFAHPDDEVFCVGSTMARAAEAGADLMMVCGSAWIWMVRCTRQSSGRVSWPTSIRWPSGSRM
jgi:hypothetical protein